MSSAAANANSSNVCVITNVDSLTGYALAYHILEQIHNRQDHEAATRRLRCLTHSHDNDLGLDVLKEMGAEIVQVGYNDENKVREAFRNVRNVLLVPEQSRDRVLEAEHIIRAAKHNDVDHFVMISITGVDSIGQNSKSEQFRNLSEYYRIEEKVKENFHGKKHCIIRHSVFNQLFYFMAPQIENENKLSLPVENRDNWTTVDLNDVCEGIWRLARKQQQEGVGRKNTYDFIADSNRTTEDHVRDIAKGLDREELRLKKISRNEMRQYLQKMREDKRFRERPQHGREEHPAGHRERDTFATLPLGGYLNDQLIETCEEFWKSATEGYQDIKSNDLRDILDRDPQNLKRFFENNRKQFYRLK